MADRRKLQSEIEKCLKKVAEGVEVFQDTWHMIYSTSNANQKEKYEMDLKKEIKKLQRLRDQIKGWIASNDIKDKRTLQEARKLIETQMERFKAVEKESKTKAYSKEGLGAAHKLDPIQKERDEIMSWLTTCIDSLSIQVDKFESEIDAIHFNLKKKKNDKEKLDQLDKLKSCYEKHKCYITQLETILRMLDNGTIEIECIKKIKDDVEYYIECLQDNDFNESMFLYEGLNLTELEEIVKLNSPNHQILTEFKSSFDEENSTIPSSTPSSSSKNSPVHSPSLVSVFNHDSPKCNASPTKLKLQASTSDDEEKKVTSNLESQPVIAFHSSSESFNEEIGNNHSNNKTISSSDNLSLVSNSTEDEILNNDANSEPSLDIESQVNHNEFSNSYVGSNRKWTNSDIHDAPSVKNCDNLFYLSSSRTNNDNQNSIFENSNRKETAINCENELSSSYFIKSLTNGPTNSVIDNSLKLVEQTFINSQLNGQIQHSSCDESLNDGEKLTHKTCENLSNELFSLDSLSSKYTTSSTTSNPVEFNISQIFGEIPQNTSFNNDYYLGILNAASQRLPHLIESQKFRHYGPGCPAKTPDYYPSRVSNDDTIEFFQRLSAETLFFIFYFLPGTKAQYFAARALKTKSWRFHTMCMMWFQRHEEPKTITDEYEQGTYIYFDYEKWAQRKKEGFTFEYKYLEDRDLT